MSLMQNSPWTQAKGSIHAVRVVCSIIKDRVRGIYLWGKNIGLANKQVAVAV
jgi:hypothetical protein